jgi:alanine racemase
MQEARINCKAILANLKKLQAESGKKIIPVVKADAYGHGAIEIVKFLQPDIVAVATISEAMALRQSGYKARIMAWIVLPEDLQTACENNIEIWVGNFFISTAIYASQWNPKCHLCIDIGMKREGFTIDEAQIVLQCGIDFVAIAAHLPEPDVDLSELKKFAHSSKLPVHLGGTCALRFAGEKWIASVRCGIGIYGYGFSQLQPVMTLHSKVVHTRKISAGEKISYDGVWQATEDCNIAVVAFGYADGFPRSATNGGYHVTIRGSKMEVVGRVCMDHILVKADDEVQIGDSVLVCDDFNDLSQKSDRSIYELLTAVGSRVKRIYLRH